MKKLLQNLLKLQELEFGDISDDNVEAAIAELRPKIPAPMLKHYDRLADHGKKPVAIVHHHVCTGCHMLIPIGAINTLMHAEDIQMCENCGRYLYLAPEDFVPTALNKPVEAPAKQVAEKKPAVRMRARRSRKSACAVV